MRSHKLVKNQYSFLGDTLAELLNPKHELYLLSNEIGWDYFEKEFSPLYSKKGRPAHPIRLMVSLLILKSMYNLSDEKLVEEHWEMNIYFQYFSGKLHQQWRQPCAASDLVYFRRRIGEQGVEKIFKHSIDKHGDDGQDSNVSIDSTVQEKNITYPTDSKLQKKIIDKCVKIANAAKRKLKTIAVRLVRELERKLPSNSVKRIDLEVFKKVLSQTIKSKNKIYSLHEPDVYCIDKGKAHKKYEYRRKASVVLTQKTGIIVGAMTFNTNVYDSHTLEDVLNQTKMLTGKSSVNARLDRGYKGKQLVRKTSINMPKAPLKRDSEYQKRKKKKHFRKRAAIEPIIGHLKQDHRAARNYLKGQTGDAINFMMAAAGFNFRKLIKKLKEAIYWLFYKLIEIIHQNVNTIFKNKYALY